MDRSEKTRELLLSHYRKYPKAQMQDLFKFLHQSAFGCEHLLSSFEFAKDGIEREYAARGGSGAAVEMLDGEYCRVPLSCIAAGLSAETFAKLFLASSKREENGAQALGEKLKVLRALICEELLPFNVSEFDAAAAEWESAGFPALHHSAVFSGKYRPSYRVISSRFAPFIPLFAELDRRLAAGRLTLAVEGGSASGKTTLGSILSDVYGCTVFHTDDFFLQPHQRTPQRYAELGGNLDRERFLLEILVPLSRGEDVHYRRFDCSSMRLADGVRISPRPLTVIEGAYSMHPAFEKYYGLSVFLNVPPEVQKKRILNRNSPDTAKCFFERWIPLETAYFSGTRARERCDMCIDIPHDL